MTRDKFDLWLVAWATLFASLIAVCTLGLVWPDWTVEAAFWRVRRMRRRRSTEPTDD